jgi:lipoprotein-anchoring transpeptidase ErfK/SrfK
MIRRRPELAEWADGMPGGPDNPLGARALYLYAKGRDTLFRIHGTNEPWSIGTAASSGCIRMLNIEVAELYENVKVGTKVIVL